MDTSIDNSEAEFSSQKGRDRTAQRIDYHREPMIKKRNNPTPLESV